MIKYIPHSEIDKEQWDACLDRAGNGFIYAYSWYLDIVSPGWDALLLGNYHAIMPLTLNEKWRIKYLYPPLFTQQLGIISSEIISSELTKKFINAIPEKFSYININLNEFNEISGNSKLIVRKGNNHEIDLADSFEKLYVSFNRNCKRNINKAAACDLNIRTDLSANSFVKFIRENLDQNLKMLNSKDYTVLETLINNLLSKNAGEISGAYTARGELCGVALFLITAKRCIFSICASSESGKQRQAMYLIVSNQIKKYAGSGKIFDFSGSNIPGIAYFNSTFGSIIKNYPNITINRLPWPIRFLKK